jgi:hypothetical protein
VIGFIKRTPSIKSIYLAGRWEYWLNYTAEHFEYNLKFFASIGLKVFIIQQGPLHNIPSYSVVNIYKRLLELGELSDAGLRNASLSRVAYVKQQAGVEKVFDAFVNQNRSSLEFIKIDNDICDEEVCAMGTVEQPFYADRVHMTPCGVRRLKSTFQKFVTY